jgi:branched-chain amino acid aminotransferase
MLEWSKLPFGYVKTDVNVRSYYKNGKWSALEFSNDENIPLHIAATSLHYGQQAFEGLKAYRGKDGKIRLFRWIENAKRFQLSAQGVLMQPVPESLFHHAILEAVKQNERFVPPYGTGATLYIRPLLIGAGAEVGVKPSAEYLFIVFVTPVGPYFKKGFKPVKIAVVRDSDRSAPLGTGTFKIGGNYAASLRGVMKAHDAGCDSPMYLDAKEKKYIDEIGAANFFGIKGNTYITPKSSSILVSITNKSIMQLAKDMGMKIEQRPLLLDEIETFDEVGACGTAAVISPIETVFDIEKEKEYRFCKDGKAGPISTTLYNKLVGIQYGDVEDPHEWIEIIN